MNIAITGSNGFVGSNYIKRNTNNIINRVCLQNTPLSKISFKNTDVVLHLAALVHQMKGAPDQEYFRVNTELTYSLAKKAQKEGVSQFIFISTIKVFGENNKENDRWDENTGTHPIEPYGQSKLKAENLIQELETNNFTVSIIRTPLIYGPGVKGNIHNLLKLIDKYPIIPFGGIKNIRSMVYTDNLCAMIDKIIATNASGIYIAGDNEQLSTTKFVEEIIKRFNKKKILLKSPKLTQFAIKKTFPSLYYRLFGSIIVEPQNSFKRLNFTPPYSVSDGISKMVEYYKLNKK